MFFLRKVFLFVLLIPHIALSADFSIVGGIVPKCDVDCNWTHLVAFVNNILKFMVFLATTGGGLLILYAAYLYITAAGDTEKIKKGHSVFKHALIGVIIVLSAWFIVDFLLRSLTGSGLEYWSDPERINN